MSLLERTETGVERAPHKTLISPEQLAQGIDLIRPLFDLEFELEPCEATALLEFVNHTSISLSANEELRADIALAKDRQIAGRFVDERHLGLSVIRKMLLDIDLVHIPVDNPTSTVAD